MRKLFLGFAAIAMMVAGNLQAQTILSEDFETDNTEYAARPVTVGDGWTTVDAYKGENATFTWHNSFSETGYASGSKRVAACDASIFESDPQAGFGPREETLLSPELDLNDTYELSFDWAAGPMAVKPDSKFDLQVRIVENNDLNDAETIFSLHDAQLLKESGVLNWPADWGFYSSKLDLSEWKGKKVKIAFVYKMFAQIGNLVKLDNVKVYRVDPVTGPVASISSNSYTFIPMYIGEKLYTEPFTLKNTGRGNLVIESVDLPDGVATTLDVASVSLERNDEVRFQLSYTATLTNNATPVVTLHTNGGDIAITLKASKTFVPDGYTLESFEGYFPPAGWKVNNWAGSSVALEGDQSAYATRDITTSYLTTPRLDLTNGGSLTFTYYDYFESEDGGTYPNNDFSVEVSTDGGKTWTEKWMASYEFVTSYQATQTVDLGKGTDNSYARFKLTSVEYDSDYGAEEGRDIYLDRVLLPRLYGEGGVPGAATPTTPKNGATSIYGKDIVLEWAPAQFATGYKLYVGSNAEATNLIDGMNVGNVLTYTIPTTDYETTYYWRVVAYNGVGETPAENVITWTFTTQPDASVSEYPYIEDFTSNTIPDGWLTKGAPSYNRNWYTSDFFPYKNGNVVSNTLHSGALVELESDSIMTPEFKLPADKVMQISFMWGDNHPRDLVVDASGLLKKENVENNGASIGIFSICADGVWTDLTTISEAHDEETNYWREEVVDLSAYAGKTVQFRWVHTSYSYGRDNGTAVAHVVLEVIADNKAIFNKPSWNAGKINYNCAVNSGDVFSLLNKGTAALKVKNVTFSTDNFESSLAAGTEIPVDGGAVFSLQFNAKDAAATINDNMTVEFENGYTVTFPVSGEALPENIYFQSFENNPLDHPWKNEFTLVDVDNKVTNELGYYLTVVENDGGRYAFTSVEHKNSLLEAHSGTHSIGAAAIDSGSADDWIISKQLLATETSTFDFYARNLGTINSVYIGDNDYHNVGVYVSETGTKISDFTAVMKDTEMSYLGENEWHHFTVDLSKYAGKNIYIAVRHTEMTANNMAFFDDFTFTNFSTNLADGIDHLHSNLSANAEVSVYNLSGVLVGSGRGNAAMESLPKGIYVVKVKDGNDVKTMRIMR